MGGHTQYLNTEERVLSPSDRQASGLMAISPGDTVKQQRPQQIPWGEGEGPSSGKTVCRTCHSSSGARLHLMVLIQAGYHTEIIAQLFRDVLWRLLVRALMKYLGKG